jgi:hypothetical protein
LNDVLILCLTKDIGSLPISASHSKAFFPLRKLGHVRDTPEILGIDRVRSAVLKLYLDRRNVRILPVQDEESELSDVPRREAFGFHFSHNGLSF